MLHDFDPLILDVDITKPNFRPEQAIEDALYLHISTTYPHLKLWRQLQAWPRMVPDLVTQYGNALTIIEIKAGPAGDTALVQLHRYVSYARTLGFDAVGLLAAPRLRVTVRPSWFGYWPLNLRISA